MVRKKIEDAIEYYMSVVDSRPKELFSYFLATGYKDTMLNSVLIKEQNDTFSAKMYLGMLITLIDDLADNPTCFNPELLKLIYSNNLVNKSKLSINHTKIINLKRFLFKNMYKHIKKLSNHNTLIDVFNFDLENIYLSNKFFELITAKTIMRNNYEIKFYGHYNMGVVAAGIIDLMGVKNINYEELGKCREIFLTGQRLAKIANTISTFAREEQEGDVTNEIMCLLSSSKNNFNFYKNKLEKEFVSGIKLIKKSKNKIKNFDSLKYAHGIEKLFDLHMSLKGKI
jgi:hypothetical protein